MQESKHTFLAFLQQHDLPESSVEKFEHYEQLIRNKNKKFNLVSGNTLQSIWVTHFLDSVLIADHVKVQNAKILDFGSGAGFPGIPLKIIYPDIELCCVESIRKKALFLSLLKTELDLSNVSILNTRFEEIISELNGSFDHIVVRAVRMDDPYIVRAFELLKPSGKLILYKSKVIDDEVDKLTQYAECATTEIIRNKILGLGNRAFIIAKKHG